MCYDALISVIIPVYNGEKYLKRTINKVLSSTYKNLEVLIVNDGSSDGSKDIYLEIQGKDLRLRSIEQSNQGIAAARNTGIKNAKGKYICFCDQDDLISEEMYYIMINKIESDGSDICLCGTNKLNSKNVESVYEKFVSQNYCKKEILNELLIPLLFAEFTTHTTRDNNIINSSIWKCLISKRLIEENNIYFKRFINYEDDWIFLIEILVSAQKISTVENQLYKWFINFGSESHKSKYITDLFERQLKLNNYIESLLRSNGVSSLVIENFLDAQKNIQIIKLFENISGDSCKIKWIAKKRYIRTYIKANNIYIKKISVNDLKKGYLRYKLVLKLVEKRKYILAYQANLFLKKVANLLFKLNVGTKIEEYLKKVKNN